MKSVMTFRWLVNYKSKYKYGRFDTVVGVVLQTPRELTRLPHLGNVKERDLNHGTNVQNGQ